MKAEAALEAARRAVLLGVRGDERRVQLERHPLGSHAQLPCVRACPHVRGAQALEQLRAGGDPLDHPIRGGVRGHLAERGKLIAQPTEVRDALAAVRQHHREVPDHPARAVA